MFSFPLRAHEKVCIKGARHIARGRTKYQKIEIVEIPYLGETLFLDGFPQISASDAAAFNELMIHAPLCASSKPREVLIAGVASGLGVAQTLRHPSLVRIHAIDIDAEAINFCRNHLSFFDSHSLSDARVTLVFDDARSYLQTRVCDKSLDAIIIDLPDPHPTSPSRLLFTREFYLTCIQKLQPNGILLTQAGRYRTGAMSYHRSIRSTCKSLFSNLKTYNFYCPSYYEPWSFLMCAQKGIFPDDVRIDEILQDRKIGDLRYYSGATDRALSHIPLALKAEADEPTDVLHD
jgi:spermidine synthase